MLYMGRLNDTPVMSREPVSLHYPSERNDDYVGQALRRSRRPPRRPLSQAKPVPQTSLQAAANSCAKRERPWLLRHGHPMRTGVDSKYRQRFRLQADTEVPHALPRRPVQLDRPHDSRPRAGPRLLQRTVRLGCQGHADADRPAVHNVSASWTARRRPRHAATAPARVRHPAVMDVIRQCRASRANDRTCDRGRRHRRHGADGSLARGPNGDDRRPVRRSGRALAAGGAAGRRCPGCSRRNVVERAADQGSRTRHPLLLRRVRLAVDRIGRHRVPRRHARAGGRPG